MGNNIPWSEGELDIVRKMAEAGKKAKDMKAVLLSRSEAAINQKAHDLGYQLHGGEPQIDFEAFKQIMKTVRQPKCV